MNRGFFSKLSSFRQQQQQKEGRFTVPDHFRLGWRAASSRMYTVLAPTEMFSSGCRPRLKNARA